jgi:mannan endo-1,6-alpha-mannosidase
MSMTKVHGYPLFDHVQILTNTDSITSVVKSLASGIVTSYKTNYEQTRIPGLFDDDLYYWWQAGNTFTELIEYAYLTGDTQYNSMISKALQHQLGDFEAFMPPNQTKNLGNEDQSYWALASLTAHEAGLDKPEHGEWIDFAVNAFNTQIVRWDQKACNGGLRWQIYTFNNGYNYRNSGTNGNFFLLATRLAHLTGNSTYSDWAAKSFDWSKSVGLISDKSYVFDGTDDVTNCSTVNKLQWTNNHAIYTEGAALMYNAVSYLEMFNWSGH